MSGSASGLARTDARVAFALFQDANDRLAAHMAQVGGASFSTLRQRVARHLLDIAAVVTTGEPAGHTRWVQDSWTAIEPYAHGAYVNFLAAEDTARTRSAYDPESWARLVRVKQQWDPENLFRVNHNIPPTG